VEHIRLRLRRHRMRSAAVATGGATRQPPPITITGTRTEDGVLLAIQDNGSGFDMKFDDRIFAIFQRLHRAEDYPGTAVGLAIVRKAMERMGGRVWAVSQPEQGATFTLQLPEA
jgi:light-regulated signal transduction histidine kinase (bacteriophytochrome)